MSSSQSRARSIAHPPELRASVVRAGDEVGCIERKTWKFLDAHAGGQPVESAAYMNESLWPSRKAADVFSRAERPEEVRTWWDELADGIEIVKTVRYVDEEG